MRWPLLRSRDFVKLWTAATVSAVGSQISALALPLTAILVLRASAFQVGLLIALKYLPLAMLGLLAGAIADRVRRRTLMVLCDLGRAAVLAAIPVAFLANGLAMWELYAVSLVAGTLDVFFDVAHPAYMVGMVGRDLLVAANARLQLSEQGASTAGPALAALLIAVVGGPLAVAVDAVSFLLSAAGLLLIRTPEPPLAQPAARRRLGAEILAGVRFVAATRSLRALVATSSLTNLFLRMLSAVLLIRLARDVGMGPAGIGLVLSIGEAGFVAGSLVAERSRRLLGLTNTFTAAAVVMCLTGLPIALAPVPLAAPITAAGLFVYGFAAVIWTINAAGYRQSITPSEMLGRVGSVNRVAAWGTIPLASVIGGAIGARWGAQTAMVVAACGALLAPAPVLAWRLRQRAQPDASPAQASMPA